MDELDCVNIFLSEGAGVQDIVAQMEARGEEVPRGELTSISAIASASACMHISYRVCAVQAGSRYRSIELSASLSLNPFGHHSLILFEPRLLALRFPNHA